MKLKTCFFIAIAGLSGFSLAQPVIKDVNYYVKGYIEIKNDKKEVLTEPFIGGFNSTQFQPIDINNDGKMDIVCFEKGDNKILPFIRQFGNDFRYAPEYERYFPEGFFYYKTADLNSDGKMDIFTLDEAHNLLVIKNITKAGDTFPRWYNYGPMYYRNQYDSGTFPILYNGLGLSSTDLPEIKDVDGDGDLDIITYNSTYQEYTMFSDVRADKKWNKDTFEFQIMDYCFGNFNDFNNTINLGQCPYKLKLKPRHSGGASILMFDNDEDGDLEMVLSNIGVRPMTFLENGKKNYSLKYDSMVAYDTIWPPATKRASSFLFPAGFLTYVDADTVLDLIVSPNGFADVKETHQLWYYRNSGKNNKPKFEFQQDDFLQAKTLDHGAKTAPAFADFDADGDMDMFVVNNGDFEVSGGSTDRVALYKNTGKADSPRFEFYAPDYFNISARNLGDVNIAFGDVDGDGDADMLVGQRTGRVSFYQNTAGKGNPFNMNLVDTDFVKPKAFFGNSNSAPCVYDYNHDNLPDLLVGYYSGQVKLFVNTGSVGSPSYTEQPGTVWGIRANMWYGEPGNLQMESFGYAMPHVADVDHDGTPEILVGCSYGQVRLFRPGTHALTDSLSDDTSWLWQRCLSDSIRPDFGARVTVTSADLDKDSLPELIFGNFRGGIIMATSGNSRVGNASVLSQQKPAFRVYPNPASDMVRFDRTNAASQWNVELYTIAGMKVRHTAFYRGETSVQMPVGDLAPGIYLAVVKNGTQQTVQKLVIQQQ